ncbi:polysaccharide biosynthesis tyrosine autokinase [Brachybacterium sp. YJGR34]|uniref:polysaccharide biosynthesis tyrosine autokinase n=1 Tax=Brachybacterium sp. YJGR34 TaxID=2059911 RepID=UPI000E0A8251|nr:polysaccharide biosynthesis tyrosine autokinase [Brachybacterium sp. YJGR34]
MTIEDFLRMLLRHLLLLVVVTAAGAGGGYGLSYTQPEVYAADALGYVSSTGQSDEDGNPIAQANGNMELQYTKAQSYLPLFSTRAVGQRVVDDLGLEAAPDDVAGSLQASLDPNAPIITVTAQAGSPQEASDIANAAVAAVAEEAASLETGGTEGATPPVQLVPYQSALVPSGPVSPDRMKYLAAGGAAGLLIALALAWMRDRNDSRIRTAQDVAAAADTALLGTLPDHKQLVRRKDGTLPEPRAFAPREGFRTLRTNLRYADVDSPPRSIVVTSSAPGEGKTTVASNLARVMARAGQPTILIDADLRRPMIAGEFAVDGEVGLSQLLAAAVSLEDALQPTDIPHLTLLPSGQVPPNPSELLGSRRMQELVEELSRTHFLLIDAPPVLAVTDAQLLARHADGALLVIRAGATRRLALSRAVDALRGVGATLYGAVMNGVSGSRFTRLAYGDGAYGYGAYGYGASTEYRAAVERALGEEVDVDDAGGPAEVHTGHETDRPGSGPSPDGGRGRRAGPSQGEG